jgi:hypothetical protein
MIDIDGRHDGRGRPRTLYGNPAIAEALRADSLLNAQQVAEVRADRELPVVWAVAKGSALNKAILVPMALAISAFAPWLVTPLLMLGGAYLCFEGVAEASKSRQASRGCPVPTGR